MCLIIRVYFFPPIGGFPPFSRGFLTPLRSGQIWEENRPIYRGYAFISNHIRNQNITKIAENGQFQPCKFTGRIHPDHATTRE